jgi:hypothetical protein
MPYYFNILKNLSKIIMKICLQNTFNINFLGKEVQYGTGFYREGYIQQGRPKGGLTRLFAF